MANFQFLHTGDIHLDSPLKGLAGQDGPAAEIVVNSSRINDQISGAFSCLQAEIDITSLRASCSTLCTQFFERSHSSLIPDVACFDSLANPDFFFSQLLVEQRFLLSFGLQGCGFTSEKRGVVTSPIEQPGSFNFDDPRRQALQEHAIVGDENQGDRLAK